MLLQQLLGKSRNPVIGLDFDGTLIDSSQRHVSLLKNLLFKYNLNLDVDNLLSVKANGISTKDYLIINGVDSDVAKSISAEWVNQIEQPIYLEMDRLYNATSCFLKRTSIKYKLVLITARSNNDGLYSQLFKFDIEKYFESIHVVDPQKAKKMKSDVARDQRIACMIGDTETDLYAALNNNIPFIHIRSCFRTEERLREVCQNFSSFDSVSALI